jgi:hypothetical protein
MALFLGAHSAALRYLLSKLAGSSATFMVEGGVAGQRLLGQVFQPSTFAVFLVLSLYLFLSKHRNWSILAIVVAATFHPTYLLCGGLMTLAYLWVIFRETRQIKAVFLYGLKALVPILPILAYTLEIFRPTNAILYAEAQHFLVYFRIPPHALISQWLNWTVAVQGIFVLAALAVLYRKSLFPIFAILAVASVLLTVVQAVTGSNTLALLFPWRVSILLVPLGVSVLLGDLVTRVMDAWQSSPRAEDWLRGLSLVVIAGLMAVGVLRFQIESADLRADPANPMMNYVAAHKSPGDIYLTPAQLANFRLVTGAPVLADFDSIPYRDADIMNWYERLQWASWFYNNSMGRSPCIPLMDLIQKYGVTRAVVLQSAPHTFCKSFPVIYQDATYRLYDLSPQK